MGSTWSEYTHTYGFCSCRWLNEVQTSVGVFQLAAFQSSANFHDGESFVPERWLPDAPPEFSKDNKDVVQPFSTGPRNCLGKRCVFSAISRRDRSSGHS
jgi:Cytochrome P450